MLPGRSDPAVPTTPRKGAPVESTGERPSVEDATREEPSYTEKEREEAHRYWARLAAAKDWNRSVTT